MKILHVFLMIAPLLVLGCAEKSKSESSARSYTAAPSGETTKTEAAGAGEALSAAPASAPAGNPGGPAVPVSRKIIYNASIDIIVEDFAKAEDGFRQLMRTQKDGYI